MKKILLFILISCAVYGCSYIGKNAANRSFIEDEETDGQINDLDLKIFRMFQENNYYDYAALIHPSLAKQLNDHSSDNMLANIARQFKGKAFASYGDFYSSNLLPDDSVIARVEKRNNPFTFSMVSPLRKTYVSILLVEDANSAYLLTLLYGTDNGKWKLAGFEVGPYSLKGRTAYLLYQQAREAEQKGDTFNALAISNTSLIYLRPGGNFITYDSQKVVKQYNKYIQEQSAWHETLSQAIADAPTHPQLNNIFYECYNDTTHLNVVYKTDVSMKDIPLVKAEFQQIVRSIRNKFPALLENNSMILFTAVNKQTDQRYRSFYRRGE